MLQSVSRPPAKQLRIWYHSGGGGTKFIKTQVYSELEDNVNVLDFFSYFMFLLTVENYGNRSFRKIEHFFYTLYNKIQQNSYDIDGFRKKAEDFLTKNRHYEIFSLNLFPF